MTMNMPPPYNQPPYYLNQPPTSYTTNPFPPRTNPRQFTETIRPQQRNINIPRDKVERLYSPNVTQNVSPNKRYIPTNVPQNYSN